MTIFPDSHDEFHDARQAWERQYEKGYFLNKPIQHELLDIAQQFKSHGVRRVLDHGCGSGRHTVYLAKQGFEVFGLDIAPTGLSTTIHKLAEEGLTGHTSLADILQMPYENGFFDAIISVRVIHHNRIAVIRKTVEELRRVLKPYGLLWVTVPVPKGHGSRYGQEIEPGTWVPTSGIEKGLPHHLFTEDGLRELFQHFTILEFKEFALSHYSVLVKRPAE
ncbi:MAG: class I SAM-dependent methyltransferase [Candidatus Hermodarchaeia archaeon]